MTIVKAVGFSFAGLMASAFAWDGTDPLVSDNLVFGHDKGPIVVEAEFFYKQTLTNKRAWHINAPGHRPSVWPDYDTASFSDAGGIAYVEVLPDLFHTDDDPIITGENLSSNGEMAVLHYKVWFHKPGRYYIWTRLRSNDQEDNTIQAGIDGTWPGNCKILQSPVEKKEWIWKSENRVSRSPWIIGRASLDVPSTGLHDIQFCMREDGEEFDRFILSQDSLFLPPVGVGPEVTVFRGSLPVPFKNTGIPVTSLQKINNPDGSVYGANVVYKDTLGMVAPEAENFYRQSLTQTRMWHLVTPLHTPMVGPDSDGAHLEGASQNAYLELLPDARQKDEDSVNTKTSIRWNGGEAAVLSYMVDFEKAGRYYVWVRAFAVDGDDNTLHVGVDNHWPESGKKLVFQGSQWNWSNKQRDSNAPVYFDIEKPGLHEVMLSMREDGCEIDRICITNNKEFLPSDTNIPPAIIKKGLIDTWLKNREQQMNTAGSYVAAKGVVVIQAESHPVTEGWTYKADKSGHTGLGYLEWNIDGQGIPAGQGVLKFSFEIAEAGNYQLFLYGKMADPLNRADTPDPDGNDIWIKFSGGSDVPHQQSLGNNWFKVAILGHPVGWTWNTNADRGKPHPLTPVCRYFDKGTWVISLSGRSKGYALDKLALAKFAINPDTSFLNNVLQNINIHESSYRRR